MIEIDKIYNEDCLIGMKRIPDGTIDCVMTDPPYRITSRGNAGNAGGMMTSQLSMRGKIFEHNDIEIEQYLPEFYRVLKDKTHCYIMCNHINLTHFLKVIDESPFHFVKSLVWVKDNKIMGGYYMNQFEYILLLRKGGDRKVNDCGISDVLQIANVKDKNPDGSNVHDSQKPVQLFRTFMYQSTDEGATILDPFMGSGTTAIACIKEKRHFIGFELSKEYFDKAVKRIKAEQAQLTLF
jgi:site-specific DNA-methyltransferase (adenine-specific)